MNKNNNFDFTTILQNPWFVLAALCFIAANRPYPRNILPNNLTASMITRNASLNVSSYAKRQPDPAINSSRIFESPRTYDELGVLNRFYISLLQELRERYPNFEEYYQNYRSLTRHSRAREDTAMITIAADFLRHMNPDQLYFLLVRLDRVFGPLPILELEFRAYEFIKWLLFNS